MIKANIMINLTKKDIIIPSKQPKLIVIVGPCRTGTTALANVFAKAGLTVYMQPIKSARRAAENGEKIVPWEIKEESMAVVKETLGAKTEAEFFDPIKILIEEGYPKKDLILIPIVRDPRKTLASWREMWNDLELLKFIRSYELILEIKERAQELGIKTVPYVHEAIKDNSQYVVLEKLFRKIGFKKNISESMVDWTKGPKFGEENSKFSRLNFYDVPPKKFIKELRNWGEYKYRDEPNLKLSAKDEEFLRQNKLTDEIYQEFRCECEKSLNIKINVKDRLPL